MYHEYYNGPFVISTAPSRLNFEAICGFLSRSYWANSRPKEVIAHSIEHSLNFGVYDGQEQVGYARVITDYATFVYLCDVYIHEAYRGHGLGKWLVKVVTNYPELQPLRRWILATRDAHELYRKGGFSELAAPEKWMEIFRNGS
ncbi:MAG: GNAT family N-acetyltransferase [Chloroflexi bacterium]|nr:GNAT family N-acetyltransferase [Chloroflexota bacterium]